MPFYRFDELEEQEVFPGYRAKFIHSQNMTFAYWHIAAGASFPEHFHVHEQVMNVLEGEFELTIDGETEILKAGVVAHIPSNVKHSGQALTDCRMIDTFYPIRDDYLKKYNK